MEFLKWTSEYEIGVPVIDEQHRGLVDCINDLAEVRDSNDLNIVNSVLGRLVEYTVNHFEFEEELQKKAGYDRIDEHKHQHTLFIHKMESFKERAEEGENVATAVLSMLKLWLLAHIKREDTGYVSVVMKFA